MTQLDISHHDPEEFEGKTIIHNNCEYVVGEYLGSGASKIVHQLINRKSGLCHHVVKIWRDEHSAAKEAPRELAAKYIASAMGFDGVPPLEEISAHGGRFEMQLFIGLYEDEGSETQTEMAKADHAFHNAKPSEAVAHYHRVLEAAPFHTVAMNNLAVAYEQLGNMGEAFVWQCRAVDIECNHLPYQTNYVKYAVGVGRLGTAMRQYEQTMKQFPFEDALDEMAILVYEKAGYPNKALEVIEHSLTKELKKKHFDRLRSDADAYSRAEELFQKAKACIARGRTSETFELLVKAHEEYQLHPMVRLNLGLGQIHRGKYAEGRDLLISVGSVLPTTYAPAIYFNAGVAQVRLGNVEEGIQLFNGAAHFVFMTASEEGTLRFSDLPGMSIWIDEEGSLEREPSVSLTAIEEAISGVGDQQDVSSEVYQLRNVFKRVTSQWE